MAKNNWMNKYWVSEEQTHFPFSFSLINKINICKIKIFNRSATKWKSDKFIRKLIN
jgi:hypothetical protein